MAEHDNKLVRWEEGEMPTIYGAPLPVAIVNLIRIGIASTPLIIFFSVMLAVLLRVFVAVIGGVLGF